MELNGTFFATLIAFLLLYGVLWKLLYNPVNKMMNDRSERIRSAIEEAEHARSEAERLLKDYKSQIATARQEAQSILDQAKALGEQTRDEINTKAREESERIVSKATDEIERSKAKAISELQSRVADLAIGAASTVIGKSLSKEDHAALIADYLGKTGSAGMN